MAEQPQQLTPEQQKELQEKLKNMSPEELQEFQKQQCIFCQIISGKIPCKKVYEDEFCMAILDINPAVKGHLLLLPKEHYAIMPQVPGKVIKHIFVAARALSQLLLKALKVSGTNVFIANGLAAGQRAQHFIIHVIPRKEGDKVIKFEEKIIDSSLQGKVKMAIENRLNELLGVKKEVVNVEEPSDEGNAVETEDQEKETAEELDLGEDAAENKPKSKPKKKSGNKPGEIVKKKISTTKKTKKKVGEDKDGDTPSERDATLDDIADLFR